MKAPQTNIILCGIFFRHPVQWLKRSMIFRTCRCYRVHCKETQTFPLGPRQTLRPCNPVLVCQEVMFCIIGLGCSMPGMEWCGGSAAKGLVTGDRQEVTISFWLPQQASVCAYCYGYWKVYFVEFYFLLLLFCLENCCLSLQYNSSCCTALSISVKMSCYFLNIFLFSL